MISEQIKNTNYDTKLPFIIDIFNEIYNSNGNNFMRGCGSYLFNGQNYVYDETMKDKAVLLYEAAKNATNVFEIGVYMGHSLLVMLAANSKLNVTCVDIDNTYSPFAIDILKTHFPEANINFINDNSFSVIEKLTNDNIKFDFFHIDGDHSSDVVKDELLKIIPLSSEQSTKIVFDDWEVMSPVSSLIEDQFNVIDMHVPQCFCYNSYYELQPK